MSRAKVDMQFTFFVDATLGNAINSYCAWNRLKRSGVLRQALNKFLQTEASNINANTNTNVRDALLLYAVRTNKPKEVKHKNKPKPAAQAGSKPIPLVELDWSK